MTKVVLVALMAISCAGALPCPQGVELRAGMARGRDNDGGRWRSWEAGTSLYVGIEHPDYCPAWGGDPYYEDEGPPGWAD